MQKFRSYVLSIAGFDPSSGAGILSDIKTFEINNAYGLGICSALTIQNDIHFQSVEWVSFNIIKKQIDILFERFSINWVKIGLIESSGTLLKIINYLIEKNSKIKIIWDPILKASAGYNFHNSISHIDLLEICKKTYLLTPNYEEIKMLLPKLPEMEAAQLLSQYCAVLVKGGHRTDNKKGVDILFFNNKIYEFEGEYNSSYKKHGSGCVLSSAILAKLSTLCTLIEACSHAKKYTLEFLKSNDSLLGYHNNGKN